MEGLSLMDKISGVVENIVYKNESNDYTVFEIVDADNRLITAVGIIPMVSEGENVELEGQWTYHKEFGKQFSFVSYEKSLPKEIDGIIQYLSGKMIKGVGPITAVKIANRFGMDTFDVIENHPEWLTDISGITRKKAIAISESFRAQSELRGVMMFFKDYMGTGEITRVYKQLGASAVGTVKDNPYILCNGDYGISFEKADTMAASFGFAPDSAVRIISGIRYVLGYNASTNGHTCLPKDKLISAAAGLLSISEEDVAAKIDGFIEAGEIFSYKDSESELIMTPNVNYSEEYIAKKLRSLSREVIQLSSMDISSLIQKVETRIGVRYADKQREAIFRCMNGGVTIITGGPGTGKTTVVKGIISIFNDLDLKTALAAPTGRAAKRMSEATGEEAKTIHRLLEMERGEGDEIKFNRNSRNPLDEKVIIVDEASMIDLSLMYALTQALKRGARLILIGDADQLPSVGAGNVLDDLIASGAIDTVRLTEIFRQSKESLIVTNAHKVNNGESPILNVTDNDFFFVRRENERDISDTVADLIMQRLPKTYGTAIKDKIQVISPSKRGAGGVELLNSALQERINPKATFKKEKASHGVIFREGDRVMQTVNNYDIEWEKNGLSGFGIFNGDIGVIESIDLKRETIDIWFDDRFVRYDFENLDQLELSYAITVHKSQGSEYPVVIIPMYSCPPMLMTRNLLYTAVTRAKKMVILVGRSDIPDKMVRNNREVLRYTTLASRLKDH
ncbi:MAG: ATP-dependent RecD-like DNA helicase [Clostridia bacterium]|nr:ATP-dependent RecD-like DNA helicase [Clostridia bacterium]